MNIPNALTLLRIVLIPVFVVVFYLPFPWKYAAAAAIFGLAALTDWLDGYLARKLRQTSRFGAFLDPVADKLMVTVALVLLVQSAPIADLGPWLTVPAAVIIGREIAVSALREWMAEIGQRGTVAVAAIGKFKTIVQMVALLLMLYRAPLPLFSTYTFPTYMVGFVLLYVAALLTLWSMILYLRAAWPAVTPSVGLGASRSVDTVGPDTTITRSTARE